MPWGLGIRVQDTNDTRKPARGFQPTTHDPVFCTTLPSRRKKDVGGRPHTDPNDLVSVFNLKGTFEASKPLTIDPPDHRHPGTQRRLRRQRVQPRIAHGCFLLALSPHPPHLINLVDRHIKSSRGTDVSSASETSFSTSSTLLGDYPASLSCCRWSVMHEANRLHQSREEGDGNASTQV